MDLKSVKKLKLNVTNIRSTLFSYNKSLKKIRLDQSSFARNELIKQKRAEKEQSIEKKPSRLSSAIEFAKSRLLSAPISIFDKIKEFFGVVLIGLLISNLPRIIKGLQKFFGDNPWIITGIKETINNVGIGLSKLIEVVQMIAEPTYKFVARNRKEIEALINNIDSLLTNIENGLIGLVGNAIMGPPPPTVNSPNYSSFVAGGGKASVKQGRSVSQVIKQGQQNISRFNSGPRAPTPAPSLPSPVAPPALPIQSFAKGGTVQPVSSNVKSRGKVSSQTKKSPFSKPGGTPSGRKAIKSTESFEKFKSNTVNKLTDIKGQKDNNNLFEDLIEKFRQLKSLKGDKDTKGGGGGGGGGGPSGGDYQGEVSVSSDSPDFWLLSTVALFENSSPQGAADVAQATYNRVAAPGDPWKTGGSIRTALLDPGQYTPVSNYGGPSAWGKIVDKKSAVEFVEKNGKKKKQLETVSSALLDSSRQSSARTFVGPRDSFRATTRENIDYDQLANDTEVKRDGHIFGFEPRGAQIEKFRQGKLQPAVVNKQTRGTVTPTAPPPKQKGDIISKDKTVVVEGEFRLRPDAAAAYKRMKADAKKEGVNISLESAWRDSSVQAYLYDLFIRGLGNLAAPPGSSDHERGIAIDLRDGIPWAQKNGLKYGWYNSGMNFSQKEPWHFDYRGGGIAQPQPQQQKPKIVTTVKQQELDKLKTVIQSKPGSKKSVNIDGVGTYIRGTNVFGMPEDKYFDDSGNPITKDEFYNRLEKAKKNSNLISSSSIPFDVKQLERNNLQMEEEDESSNILIAQQPIYLPGQPIPMPYPVVQKTISSSNTVSYNPESLVARGLV